MAAGAPAATGSADRSLPAEMRASRFHAYGGPEQLRLERVPVPTPGPGQVLIEVHAASVNPIDWKVREGALRARAPIEGPVTPGRDASGIVRAVGAGVTGWRAGDAVVAVCNGVQGCYADYAVVAADEVARKPAKLSFVEAAAFPLVAVTAWNSVNLARVGKGDTVLVHGGAGGVGAFAVQFAAARGARVIATASARNLDLVRSFGAAEAIDYRATKFEDVVRDVDVVIDTVGGETLARSPAVLKRGGRLVTIAGRPPQDACRERALECGNGNASTAGGIVAQVTREVDEGRARVVVDRTYPLAQAAEAQEANRAGGGRGKIVLEVRPARATTPR